MKMKVWRAIRSFFSFRTYGDSLLTKRSAQWLLMAQIMVFIIAFTEAMSWGYFGSLLSLNLVSKILFAFIIGLFVFIVIWNLDSTLMTLDRDHEIYEQLPDAETIEAVSKTKKLFKTISEFVKKQKFKISTLLRVAMLILSLQITAPFLDEMVFNGQIVAQINGSAAKTIAQGRDSVSKIFDTKILAYETQLSQKQDLLAKEIAGSGLSKRYGVGPVANQLKLQIQGLKTNITYEHANKSTTIGLYNTLVNNKEFDKLRTQFDIRIPQNSISERSRVIKPILESTDAKRFMYAIRGFLAFLFFGLIIMKIFQPPAITIYFSETLQSFYERYKTGGLNGFIKVEDRFNGKSPFDALRFRNFMRTVYKAMSKNANFNEEHDRNEDNIELIKSKIASLKTLSEEERGSIIGVYGKLKHDVIDKALSISNLKVTLNILENTIERLTTEIKTIDEAITKLENASFDTAENITTGDITLIISMRNKDLANQKNKRNETAKAYRTAKEELVSTLNQVSREELTLAEMEARIKAYEEPLLKYQAGISYLTDKQIELILKPVHNLGKTGKKNKSDDDDKEPPILKVV